MNFRGDEKKKWEKRKKERNKLVVFVLASNHFWKCFSINSGVWLCMKNKFSRNYFQKLFSVDRVFWRLWPENGLKWKFSLQTIFGLTRKEREREPSTSTSSIYEPTNLWTDHAFDFANFADHAFNFADLRTDLRPTDLWTHELIFDLEP